MLPLDGMCTEVFVHGSAVQVTVQLAEGTDSPVGQTLRGHKAVPES